MRWRRRSRPASSPPTCHRSGAGWRCAGCASGTSCDRRGHAGVEHARPERLGCAVDKHDHYAHPDRSATGRAPGRATAITVSAGDRRRTRSRGHGGAASTTSAGAGSPAATSAWTSSSSSPATSSPRCCWARRLRSGSGSLTTSTSGGPGGCCPRCTSSSCDRVATAWWCSPRGGVGLRGDVWRRSRTCTNWYLIVQPGVVLRGARAPRRCCATCGRSRWRSSSTCCGRCW